MAPADRERWNRKFREGHPAREPSPRLAALTPLLARPLAVELAAGWGANAAHLRAAGFTVFTVDIADVVRPDVLADLEYFTPRVADTIVCVRYLDRRAIARWIEALRPGGTIFLEAHLSGINPRYCLRRGELRGLLSGLEELHYEEGPGLATVLSRRARE